MPTSYYSVLDTVQMKTTEERVSDLESVTSTLSVLLVFTIIGLLGCVYFLFTNQ